MMSVESSVFFRKLDLDRPVITLKEFACLVSWPSQCGCKESPVYDNAQLTAHGVVADVLKSSVIVVV